MMKNRLLAILLTLVFWQAGVVLACPECEKLALDGVLANGKGTRWSDPATWAGGKVPEAGQVAVIPEGRSITLDVSSPLLKGMLVKGQLRLDRKNIDVKTGWILVMGKDSLFEVGTEAEPFQQNAVFTFFGTYKNESIVGKGLLSTGTKFLCAMQGGRIELHGGRRDAVSWTQLNAHAEPGAKEITLKDNVRWQAGDQICIAPSGYNPLEAEMVTVKEVAGKVVKFEPALKHKHWGTLQTFENRTLDERAEVGLLTRNIVLQGAEESLTSGFGGHVMIMPGGTAHVEGVEFKRMGQKGLQGRYPMHWHLVDRRGDGSAPGKGQYAKNNSVHHSFQRAIVVHGTSNVHVEGNVAFDIANHCYVPSEDGDEENNQFIRNLGMLVRMPSFDDYAFPGKKKESSDQNEAKASVFWMTNPNQTFIGNHAAGSIGGDGFLFDGRVIAPRKVAKFNKHFLFKDNVAHSNQKNPKNINNLVHYGAGVQNFGLSFDKLSHPRSGIKPDEVRSVVIENFTAYKNASGGVWLESQREVLKDSILADHYVSCQFGGGGGCLENVVILRNSANKLGEEFAPGLKSKSTGLYVENGSTRILSKGLVFIGQDAAVTGYPRNQLEPHQRLDWRFVNVKDAESYQN